MRESSRLQTHASDQTRGTNRIFIHLHWNYSFCYCTAFHVGHLLIPLILSIRLLEEGKVPEADKKKDEVEEKQRERRKEMTKKGEEHIARFFR